MKKEILVAGGAGYIGSITVKSLLDLGYNVTIADNFEKRNELTIDPRATVAKGDLLDMQFVRSVFKKHFDGVINFAGYIDSKESTQNPGRYFINNIGSSMNILEGMTASTSDTLVFSSSAAVYGNKEEMTLLEDTHCSPTSPYGETKLMTENILKWYPIKNVSLRYFNAAGAMLDGTSGESHSPETHIIPIAIEKSMRGEEFTLFGTDYNTPDGTCVRDYIHVLDLARAHILALQALWSNTQLRPAYNVGSGNGYSNKEVLTMVEKVSGKKIKIKNAERREGDPAQLIANNFLIKQDLGFNPKYSDLETIVQTAYSWHLNALNSKNMSGVL